MVDVLEPLDGLERLRAKGVDTLPRTYHGSYQYSEFAQTCTLHNLVPYRMSFTSSSRVGIPKIQDRRPCSFLGKNNGPLTPDSLYRWRFYRVHRVRELSVYAPGGLTVPGTTYDLVVRRGLE